MIGLLSSASGNLNTLLLLLLWCNAHADECPQSTELKVDMNDLLAKNCPRNCDAIHPSDSRCKCLNISFSKENVFPSYFIEGLQLLNNTSRSLNRRLNNIASNSACMEKLNKMLVNMTFEARTPPALFLDKLKSMWNQLNMAGAAS